MCVLMFNYRQLTENINSLLKALFPQLIVFLHTFTFRRFSESEFTSYSQIKILRLKGTVNKTMERQLVLHFPLPCKNYTIFKFVVLSK